MSIKMKEFFLKTLFLQKGVQGIKRLEGVGYLQHFVFVVNNQLLTTFLGQINNYFEI
jgi:hypothetical protein